MFIECFARKWLAVQHMWLRERGNNHFSNRIYPILNSISISLIYIYTYIHFENTLQFESTIYILAAVAFLCAHLINNTIWASSTKNKNVKKNRKQNEMNEERKRERIGRLKSAISSVMFQFRQRIFKQIHAHICAHTNKYFQAKTQ